MLIQSYLKAEKIVIDQVKKIAPACMRYSLGLTFFWFGFLKIIGLSPISELVKKAAFLINEHHFVIGLGFWEVCIGVCFCIKKFNRIALVLFFMLIPGTFVPVFINPEDCFTVFPYGLTLEGQYIFKNFILISGALYVLSNLQEARGN
ncbi:MAG: hypothetical protein FJZ56_02155 [Chlamydiae bacterium]|nr:hypothetical protein [Chlamydiota bacterium]